MISRGLKFEKLQLYCLSTLSPAFGFRSVIGRNAGFGKSLIRGLIRASCGDQQLQLALLGLLACEHRLVGLLALR